jgi:hypothetical protein
MLNRLGTPIEPEDGRPARLPLQLQLFSILVLCCSYHRLKTMNGKWTKRVVRVEDYPETKFSHGYCPSCTRKLYPDIFAKKAGAPPDTVFKPRSGKSRGAIAKPVTSTEF